MDELSRLLLPNSKIYDTRRKQFGQVVNVTGESVEVNFGTTREPLKVEYDRDEYSDAVLNEAIVAKVRTYLRSDDTVGIKKLDKPIEAVNVVKQIEGAVVEVPTQGSPSSLLDNAVIPSSGVSYIEIKRVGYDAVETHNNPMKVGYINLKTGKFSESEQKGYIKIEYKPVTTKVVLDLDSEQVEKLKELGILNGTV